MGAPWARFPPQAYSSEPILEGAATAVIDKLLTLESLGCALSGSQSDQKVVASIGTLYTALVPIKSVGLILIWLGSYYSHTVTLDTPLTLERETLVTRVIRLVISLLLCLSVPFSAWGSAVGAVHGEVSQTVAARHHITVVSKHAVLDHCHQTGHATVALEAIKKINAHHSKCFCGCGVNACGGASAIGHDKQGEPALRIVSVPVYLLINHHLSAAHNGSLLRPPRFQS